ncbi:choice-of-anchor L domain-containing protein [Faecalibacter sp. LW9]|uniref:choice-of-anchor L domain-containing protein n=1 Tax=Faecalibacter sp. LW9 TaxID=3103144 RepID=UPI002AFE47A0|nr:choice-of-anchor L domain-containing protein [Faecalibacter sp. LW9]
MKYIYHLFLLFTIGVQAQFIQVNSSYTPTQLVKDIFLGSDCIEIDERSIEISGYHQSGFISYGYFDKGTSDFPLENGILLSTGNLNAAVGPNNYLQSFTANNWEGDRDLEEALEIQNTLDATILEFDFISLQDDRITFEYIFASEQYLRTASEGRCGYTDGFAFLIKEVDSRDDYQNIAVIPYTSIPVSVLTIFGNGGLCPPINPQYFRQFNIGHSATNFNGETVVLNAVANIIPGKKYHIKLVIADQGNGLYDSGVFLKAGSFSGGKDLGEDLLVATNNALCLGETTLLDATTPNATSYKWYKDNIEIIGATDATYIVNLPGNYRVEILLPSGCTITAERKIEYYSNLLILQNHFEFCDEDLDGSVTLNLMDYNYQIIANANTVQIKYYNTLADAEANRNEIHQLDFTTSEHSKTIFVAISTDRCSSVFHPISFSKKTLSSADPIPTIEICDELLDHQEAINLEDYLTFIPNLNDDYRFFTSEIDARNNINPIRDQQNLTGNMTFYIRFSQADLCENIMSISFVLKQAKRSETLVDHTICEGTTTTLNAGDGFESYLWLHNGSTSPIITDVPVGTYHVRLELNGCFYTQEVVVHAAENPVIENIIVSGNTVTVIVANPNPSYMFALDDGNFQNSHIFYNVSIGNHTIAVQSSNECLPVFQTFSIVNMVNFISPNSDGINDVLDYSDLMYKLNPKFQVYNRYGHILFEGSTTNHFIWDGTFNGKTVASGNYWYTLEWTEPGSEQVNRQTNSILVKSK